LWQAEHRSRSPRITAFPGDPWRSRSMFCLPQRGQYFTYSSTSRIVSLRSRSPRVNFTDRPRCIHPAPRRFDRMGKMKALIPAAIAGALLAGAAVSATALGRALGVELPHVPALEIVTG